MSAMKRLLEDVYYEYLEDVLSIEQIAEKYHVTEQFVLDAIAIMSDEDEEDQ